MQRCFYDDDDDAENWRSYPIANDGCHLQVGLVLVEPEKNRIT